MVVMVFVVSEEQSDSDFKAICSRPKLSGDNAFKLAAAGLNGLFQLGVVSMRLKSEP
ncbi:MAG: hypothetical protein HKM94_11265 [Halobacteria archaeon]|nr:hypothetical protein [Halobacteria archaeon]